MLRDELQLLDMRGQTQPKPEREGDSSDSAKREIQATQVAKSGYVRNTQTLQVIGGVLGALGE